MLSPCFIRCLDLHAHSHFMDGSTTLSSLLDRLDDKLDKEGLDFLNPGRYFLLLP